MGRSSSFWAKLDEMEASGMLHETAEEIREYSAEVREEMTTKGNVCFPSNGGPSTRLQPNLRDAVIPQYERDLAGFPAADLAVGLSQNQVQTEVFSSSFPSQSVSRPPPSFKPSDSRTAEPYRTREARHATRSIFDDVSAFVVTQPPSQSDALLVSSPQAAVEDIPEAMKGSEPLAAADTTLPPIIISQLPSFRQSQFLGMSTPQGANATFPMVPSPSPSHDSALPPPQKTAEDKIATPRSWENSRGPAIDTPENIPSPVDTPVNARNDLVSSIGFFGQVQRDNAATPVGKKSKAELTNVTHLFNLFTKKFPKQTDCVQTGLETSIENGKRKGQGRTLKRKVPDGKPLIKSMLFENCRFCYPSNGKPLSVLKGQWDAIAERTGVVTLEPDSSTTHVIYDSSSPSASKLCDILNIDSLTRLPTDTAVITWEWVNQCILVRRIVPIDGFQSFPPTVFTSKKTIGNQNGKADFLNQLRHAGSTRGRDSSDSDPEPEGHMPRKRRLGHFSRIKGSTVTIGSSRLKTGTVPNFIDTEHDLPDGPGWKAGASGERDPLDSMIEGVKADNGPESEISGSEGDEGDEGNDNQLANNFKCGQKNDGKDLKGPNEWLAEKLDFLHLTYEGQIGKNPHSIRQYRNAAAAVRRTTFPITSGAQARKIRGIGDALADRIDEFICGAPGRAYYEDNEQARCVAMFNDIYGVGRKHAYNLYLMGARSIEDLRSGRFPLSFGQKVGLDLYDDLKIRIPREECKQIYEIIKKESLGLDAKLWVEIMGSYRRGQETSGDVDILITRDDSDGKTHRGVIKRLVDNLKEKNFITHEMSSPHDLEGLETKWMGVGRISPSHHYRRIDILCTPYESWGASLLYFTGNELFNRSLRLYARKMGYSLNQRGLYSGVVRKRDGTRSTEGILVASQTEQEIFDKLGIRWRHPSHRRP